MTSFFEELFDDLCKGAVVGVYMPSFDNQYGVWTVFKTAEVGYKAISYHTEAAAAIKSHGENHGSHIMFWPENVGFDDAVVLWQTSSGV